MMVMRRISDKIIKDSIPRIQMRRKLSSPVRRNYTQHSHVYTVLLPGGARECNVYKHAYDRCICEIDKKQTFTYNIEHVGLHKGTTLP